MASLNKGCLFCRKTTTVENYFEAEHDPSNIIDYGHVSGEVTIKTETARQSVIVPAFHADFLLEAQLKSVFILRMLLDLPEETCAKYLAELNNGQLGTLACHPSDWFILCGKCNELVEKCYSIHREVLRWKKQLDKKKEGLKRGIVKALGKAWEELKHDPDSLFGNFKSFLPEKESVASSVSFQAHQRRSSSRIMKKLQSSKNLIDLEVDIPDGNSDHENLPSTSRPFPPTNKSACSDDEWQPSDSEMETVPVDSMDMDELASKKHEPIQESEDNKIYPGLDLNTITKRKFRCNVCVASYDLKRHFNCHLKAHQLPPGTTVKCGRCGWAFETKVPRSHNKHCLAATKMLYCSFCPASYLQERCYLKHIILHDKTKCTEETRTCAMCGWVTTRKDMKNHFFKKHNKIDDVQHDVEESKMPYYCDHCHLIFPSQMHIISHVNFGHRDATLLDCDKCPCSSAKFESKQLLQIHCQSAHGEVCQTSVDKEEDSPCLHCSERFPTKMKRDYHIAKYHLKEQLVCPICKKFQAKEFNLLRKHMDIHDPNGGATMCELCSKMILKTTMQSHKQLFHYKELGLKPIQCKECQMIFRSEKQLQKHMDFVHLHNTPSCCHLCTKKYKHKGDLDRHIQTHMNPTKHVYKKGPFFCKICQATFNVRQGLYYHMKRLHSDKYLYRCDTCGKGYCFENTLLDHQMSCKKESGKNLVHTNEPVIEQL